MNEITTLTKADHPNIVKLVGKYRDEENYNIITEYCNGGNLQNFIKKYGGVTEKISKEIAR